MMNRKNIFILMMMFFIVGKIFSEQKIDISIDYDKIGIDEVAVIEIPLSAKAEITVPEGEGFEIKFQGQSTSHNVTFVNGKISSATTYTYKYRFNPNQTGTYEIEGFKIEIDGEVLFTDPITIEVVEEPQKQNSGSTGYNPYDPFSMMDEIFGGGQRQEIPPLSMEVEISRTQVYKNQAILVSLIAKSTNMNMLNSQYVEVNEIVSSKTKVYDITESLDTSLIITNEFRDEEQYQKTIKSYVIYPLESGELNFYTPAFVAVTPYGQMQIDSRVINLQSKNVGDESGIYYIGDIEVTQTVETNTVSEGKVFRVKFQMIGDGNLKVFSDPYENIEIEGLYISSPNSDVVIYQTTNDTVTFLQTVEYSILAQKEGEYQIPPVEFFYYDTDINEKTLLIDSVNLNVISHDMAITSDIDLIPKALDNIQSFDFIMLSPVYLSLLALFLMIPILSIYIGRHRNKMSSDYNYSRQFLANKKFSNYLSGAAKNLKNNDYKEFYLSLQKGMFYYVTDKLGLPNGIGIKELNMKLTQKGVKSETVEQFDIIYKECLQNAYSGVAKEETAEETLKMVKKIFDAIR